MPTSINPLTLTEEEGAKVQAEVDQQLGALTERLGAAPTTVDDAAVRRTNREFGKQLSPVAQAAADTCQKGGPVFKDLPVNAATLRARDTHVRLLQSAKNSFEHAAELIGQCLQAAKVDLAGDIRTVVQFTDAMEALPTTQQAVREVIALAARPMRTLLQDRQDGARANYLTTRATNLETEASLSQKDDEVTTLRQDNSRLAVENRYLAGEQLRPEDVASSGAHGASAPGASSRTAFAPRPATAPRGSRRRGRR